MNYKPFGRTGVQVSSLCLGCGNFGGPTSTEDSARIIDEALGAGINMLDTADRYHEGESERAVGAALKRNGRRDHVFLATKFVKWARNREVNEWGLSRRYIVRACEASLKRLQTDHIDLYQVHRPFWDVALDETLKALDDLVTSGKVRYLGTSNYAAWELMEAIWAARSLSTNRFVSEQPAYNLLTRRIERELVPFAQTYGTALITWSPLAQGLFGGTYRRGENPPSAGRIQSGSLWGSHLSDACFDVLETVANLAAAKGCTTSQFALAWVEQQPGVTCPIVGPRTIEQLRDNLAALRVKITAEDRQHIDAVSPSGDSVVGGYGFPCQPHTHRW